MEPLKKRQRTANFSKFEIDILVEIIGKYKDIMENKKSYGVSVGKKVWTWQNIDEFNSSPGNFMM